MVVQAEDKKVSPKRAEFVLAVESTGMKPTPYHLNPRFELIETELICHCEHCREVRVPSFLVRRWLSQADEIVLPGLDGPLVIRASLSDEGTGPFGAKLLL